MANNTSGISPRTATIAGAGAAAALVAGIGAYWLYGAKNAPRNRKLARSWMLKARAEVLEAIEAVIDKAGEIDKDTYMNIVDTVLKGYRKGSDITAEEMAQITRDMKDTWAHIQKTRARAPQKKRTTARGTSRAPRKKKE